jgi:hypothetical protein
MPEPLDFREKPDAASDSWTRADPHAALLERQAWDVWPVTLPCGSAHSVRLRRESGAYVGRCDCAGVEHHDGPYAHLCTVRKAEFGHVADVSGRRVRALDPEAERAQALADGGERR